ncbi:type VI immunity family protein [Myxococcus stipitatus]|uniref:type VI immunity family protein n=1 Tax=Myxococcus stipitatus TaxID=83455 RepID=UPI0030CFEB2D
MGEHIPRVRRTMAGADAERLLVREVVRIVLYLPHDHVDLASGVERALDLYRKAVGEEVLTHGWDAEEDGEPFPLTAEGWSRVQALLHARTMHDLGKFSPRFEQRMKIRAECSWTLTGGGLTQRDGYALHYQARLPMHVAPEGGVSVLSATLPTEYLNRHGPGRVRELAMALASGLPLSSGHAGLALALFGTRGRVLPLVRDELERHPGLDVPAIESHLSLGSRVDGVHWVNFLGPALLEAAGGVSGLRARLQSPGTTVDEVGGSGTAVVTLGAWPSAGDLSKGDNLPSYRELARVLEPWLEAFQPSRALGWRGFSEEDVRRWWRRFLD